MRLKTWGTVLELRNSKSTLTEADLIKQIAEFIEELSSKNVLVNQVKKRIVHVCFRYRATMFLKMLLLHTCSIGHRKYR